MQVSTNSQTSLVQQRLVEIKAIISEYALGCALDEVEYRRDAVKAANWLGEHDYPNGTLPNEFRVYPRLQEAWKDGFDLGQVLAEHAARTAVTH